MLLLNSINANKINNIINILQMKFIIVIREWFQHTKREVPWSPVNNARIPEMSYYENETYCVEYLLRNHIILMIVCYPRVVNTPLDEIWTSSWPLTKSNSKSNVTVFLKLNKYLFVFICQFRGFILGRKGLWRTCYNFRIYTFSILNVLCFRKFEIFYVEFGYQKLLT